MDQAGFNNSFSCNGYLFTLALLSERCVEFSMVWAAALDFEKEPFFLLTTVYGLRCEPNIFLSRTFELWLVLTRVRQRRSCLTSAAGRTTWRGAPAKATR